MRKRKKHDFFSKIWDMRSLVKYWTFEDVPEVCFCFLEENSIWDQREITKQSRFPSSLASTGKN